MYGSGNGLPFGAGVQDLDFGEAQVAFGPIYSMGWLINSQLFCLLHRLGGIFAKHYVPTFFGCCLGQLWPPKWHSRCLYLYRGPIMPSFLEVRTFLVLLLLV